MKKFFIFISFNKNLDSIKRIIFALKENFPKFIVIKEHQFSGTVVRLGASHEVIKKDVQKILEEIETNNLAEKIYGL